VPIWFTDGRSCLRYRLLSASALLILSFAARPVFATDRHWTGATSTTWSTSTNWDTTPPGGTSDNAVFNNTFTNQPNLGATATAGGLWMTGSVGQNVTISGSTLTLQGNTIGGTTGLGILVDNANGFTFTITAPLKLGAAQTWRNNSGNLLTIGAGGVNTNGKALTVDGSGNTTISGVLSSSGAITKAGSGTLTLSNTGDTYTGQLTVQAGTLSIDTINNASANGELGNNALSVILGNTGSVTGTLEYTSGTASSTKKFTMATGGTGAFQVDTAGTTLTVSGVIDGSGALSKTGSGTLSLTGSNTYSGGTNINGGTLNVGSSGALASSGTISFGGGTLQYSASNTTDYSSRFSTASNQAYSIDTNSKSVTFATALTSSGGSLTKLGSGTLTLSGANTYSGGTTLSAGTLQLSDSGTLGSTSGSLTVNGATLDLNGTSQGVGNFTGSGGTVANNSTGTNVTLTIGNGNGTGGNYAGIIADHTSGTGTVALTKTGTGTITLSGANTFSGATTVSNGTLTLATSSGSALGSTSGITVSSGGTLLLGASDQINNSATMTLGGGTVSKGNYSEGTAGSVGVGALTLTANSHIDFGTGTVGVLTFATLNASSFTLTIDNWTGQYNQAGSASTDRLIFDSDQTLNLAAFNFTGYTGAVEFALGGGFYEVVPPIPEPSTWEIGILGVGAVGYSHLRRRWSPVANKSPKSRWALLYLS
jgi:fibronectin-binding autotransporter adhesin